jgi:hypothetical protein
VSTIGRLAPRWLATVESVMYDVDAGGASARGVHRVHGMLSYMSRYGRLKTIEYGNETSVSEDDRQKFEHQIAKHNIANHCSAPLYNGMCHSSYDLLALLLNKSFR